MIQKLHKTDMAAAKIHDIHVLIALITDSCILLPPEQEPIRGRDAIWKFMQEQLPENQKYDITKYIQNFEEIKIIGNWPYEFMSLIILKARSLICTNDRDCSASCAAYQMARGKLHGQYGMSCHDKIKRQFRKNSQHCKGK
jgi:hypothetical protein